jgi:transcriptional regulator with XRE-family HTH domain
VKKDRKVDLYLADRANGMTYRQIAEKYGVSYQAVHTSCVSAGVPPHKLITEKGCIYPNLRAWLNMDKIRRDRFFRDVGTGSIRMILNGSMQPKKNVIDKMLNITGMTYEELFAEEEL